MRGLDFSVTHRPLTRLASLGTLSRKGRGEEKRASYSASSCGARQAVAQAGVSKGEAARSVAFMVRDGGGVPHPAASFPLPLWERVDRAKREPGEGDGFSAPPHPPRSLSFARHPLPQGERERKHQPRDTLVVLPGLDPGIHGLAHRWWPYVRRKPLSLIADQLTFEDIKSTGKIHAPAAKEVISLQFCFGFVGSRKYLHRGWVSEFRQQFKAKAKVTFHAAVFCCLMNRFVWTIKSLNSFLRRSLGKGEPPGYRGLKPVAGLIVGFSPIFNSIK